MAKMLSEAQKAALARGRAKAVEAWKAKGGKWKAAAEAMERKVAHRVAAEESLRKTRKPALGPVKSKLRPPEEVKPAEWLAAARQAARELDPKELARNDTKCWAYLCAPYFNNGTQLLLNAALTMVHNNDWEGVFHKAALHKVVAILGIELPVFGVGVKFKAEDIQEPFMGLDDTR